MTEAGPGAAGCLQGSPRQATLCCSWRTSRTRSSSLDACSRLNTRHEGRSRWSRWSRWASLRRLGACVGTVPERGSPFIVSWNFMNEICSGTKPFGGGGGAGILNGQMFYSTTIRSVKHPKSKATAWLEFIHIYFHKYDKNIKHLFRIPPPPARKRFPPP